MKPVYKAADHPKASDPETSKDLARLFDYLFPGEQKQQFKPSQAGYAIVARDPKLAHILVQPARHMFREMAWSKREGLRELAIQTANYCTKCDFSFEAHLPAAKSVGISLEQQAMIPFWRTASVFSDEEKLVIEYSMAVVSNDVPAELFNRVKERYGEKEMLEFTTIVAWWAFWSMIINTYRPSFKD
jgi:alkylhydroperoxidase family enzyme